MAGRMSFRQHAETYLQEYLAFRRYGNNTIKKKHLQKWLSAAVAKDTVTVEDMEYLLICFYSSERKNIPKVVEALAHPTLVGLEITDLDEVAEEKPRRQGLNLKNRIK